MPHTKKQRLEGHPPTSAAAVAENDFFTSFDDLSVDVLANIFKFLPLEEIMCSRCLNKKSADAVKMTIVPLGDFRVNNIIKYHTMAVMTRALPNLQQIDLRGLGNRHKWSDGEDPEEGWAYAFANWTSHDIEIIANFSKLRVLDIEGAPLNGRYPFLFNSFPLLQKLSINECGYLKWDLGMLAGMPLLKELVCWENPRLTGNISSLRVLKDTLEKVQIFYCDVEGNFMDLADFPHLKKLELFATAVTGDFREIGVNDFSSLEKRPIFHASYKLQRISDAPELMRAVYLLSKQRPALINIGNWSGGLSQSSPDWYEPVVEDCDDTPPFFISFVKAGFRVGYRWNTMRGDPCEVNWLDPEPGEESGDYAEYIMELQDIECDVDFYSGYHQPPTQAEYEALWEQHTM